MTYEDAEHPVYAETYTVPELARALGKAELTIRRWIEADKIPAPYLRDTSRGLRVYSAGEVSVMVDVLVRHGRDFSYLSSVDSTLTTQMREAMHAYRSHNV